MTITVEEDLSSAEGGRAIVWLDVPLGGADPGLVIRRVAGEPENLGRRGWQAGPATLAPESAEDIDGRARIVVGPEICEHLAEDAQIELGVPSVGASGIVFWPYVAPASRAERGNSLHVERREASAEVRPKTAAAAGPAPVAEQVAPMEQASDAPPSGAEGPDGAEDIPPPPRSRWPILAAIALVLLLSAGAAYQFYGPELLAMWPADEGDTVASQENPGAGQAGPEAVRETGDASDTGAGGEGEPSVTVAEIREQVRDCPSQGCSMETLMGLGRRLIENSDYDTGFRAVDYAAQRGHAPALRQIGNWYDPLHFEPQTGLSRPDPEKAAAYYRDAVEAGSAEGQQDLAAMCDELDRVAALEEAATGDPAALTPDEAAAARDAVCSQ